jgi:hypothetical protein
VSQTKRPQSILCMNCSFLGVPHSIQAYGIISMSYAVHHLFIPWQGPESFQRLGATPEVWVPEGWLSICEMIYTFLCVRKKLTVVLKMVGTALKFGHPGN